MLELRRLRLLHELRLRGTIAEVARVLSFTPSAVSQQLATLEQEVGVPLLHRQGRRVALTPQGLLLADRAAELLELLERAEREVADSVGRATGRVRLVTFQSATLALLPPLLQVLSEQHPLLRVEVVQHEPESALWKTYAGDFDLVVAEEYPQHAAPHHPGIDRVPLGADPLRLALPPGDAGAGLADAAERPWVMEPAGTASRHWAEQRCRVAGFEPDVRFETADLQAHLRLIEAGHAVGFLNGLTAVPGDGRARLIELPGSPCRTIFTAARTASAGSPEIAAVRAALAAVSAGRLLAQPR